ncbi:MAG TPA: class I SAM-dependent methyltransferase [Spirochaetia bacterium]|nr:class I SAM-dependent methyltransferase [Spirochaetia bacterium]
MKDGRSSDTALGASVIRAVHQILDEKPPILEDPISPVLVGNETLREIQKDPEKYRTLPARALRSHIVLRSRYAEDELHRAVESGITQLVSVGAGYDTFALRQPEWARTLKIVEVDHPASQRAKLETIRRAQIPVPPNEAFVPLDLEEQELESVIANGDVDPVLPTFVACLGVLAYLRPETVRRVFKSVVRMAKGSRFVFAFASSQGSVLATKTAALGEPWLARFDLDDLKAELIRVGFSKVSFLDPAEATERYYRGRHDLPAPQKTSLCQAVV